MLTVPGSELAIRDWIRADATIVGIVGGDARRIDVDISGSKDTTHMTMYRVGGAPSNTVPLDRCLMSFDCWGRGRGSALSLATALQEKLVNSREQPLNDDVRLRGCAVMAVRWVPDPTGQPRYVVTALITTSARQAVAA
jgi:hypothetical protein